MYKKGGDATQEISFKDILKRVKAIPESPELNNQEIQQTIQAELVAKKLELELFAQKQYLDLQKTYANDIKKQIWAVLIFQFSFILLVGFNIFSFTNNIVKLPYMYIGVILQTLANIVALGFIVVQFLFPRIQKQDGL